MAHHRRRRCNRCVSRCRKQEAAQRLTDSLHAVTEAMLERTREELNDNKLCIMFSVFDLSLWTSARRVGDSGDFAQVIVRNGALERRVKRLFRAWRLDESLGVREFTGVVYKLMEKEDREHAGTKRDNRLVWSQIFDTDEFGPLEVLPALVKIYMATLDGTCGVERDLGTLTRILAAHTGPTDEDSRYLLARNRWPSANQGPRPCSNTCFRHRSFIVFTRGKIAMHQMQRNCNTSHYAHSPRMDESADVGVLVLSSEVQR